MHLASDQKDLLISQLKAEIFEIQQRDKDFLALRDQLYSIQSKYRHLQDEKVRDISKGVNFSPNFFQYDVLTLK